MPAPTVAEADVGLLRRRLARPGDTPSEGSRPGSSIPVPWETCPAAAPVVRAVAGRGRPLVAHGEAAVVARVLRRELRALGPALPGRARGWIEEIAFLVRLFSTVSQDPTPRVLLTAVPGQATAPPEDGDEPWALSLTAWFPKGGEEPGTAPGAERPDRPGRPQESCARFHRGAPAVEDLPGRREEGLLLRVATPRRPFFLDDSAALDADRLPQIEGPVDVLLVSMPFAYLQHPSIALSLLRQTLPQELRTEVLYFTFAFAEIVGPAFYEWIASGKPSPALLLGEWAFSAGLGFEDDGGEPYLDEVLGRCERAGAVPEAAVPWLRRMRREATGFLDRAAERVLAAAPRLVGFTSVFQQHAAALGLARRLKARRPELPVVFGGANCEGVMGRATLRRFGWVDAVVSGEGERIFPELVERLLSGRSAADLPGVSTRETVDGSGNGEPVPDVSVPNAPAVERMDDLPVPDYEDHFRHWRHSTLGEDYAPRPLFETARGCWWGEKHHCTFCGLNGSGMAFRSKSPERVLAELEELTARHPGSSLAVVDNILDMRYLRTLVPELARRLPGLELFYEVKANLKKEHLRLLRDAGIREIQPGIESLSTEVLRLMRKGVSGLQNLQLLRWCKEVGVRPHWNFLWGFAGEPPAEYERMERLIPWLSHLQPPEAVGAHRLDRFSPNFFDGERLGYRDISPHPAYRHVYGRPGEDGSDLADLAYYFRYRHRDGREVESYVAGLRRRLEEWQEVHESSDLVAFDRDGRLLVFDYRPAAVAEVTVLSGLGRELLLACDRVRSLGGLARSFSLGGDREMEESLASLLDLGLVVREGDRVLALPVPVGSSA